MTDTERLAQAIADAVRAATADLATRLDAATAALAPLQARLETLEARALLPGPEGPTGQPGQPGDPGPPGPAADETRVAALEVQVLELEEARAGEVAPEDVPAVFAALLRDAVGDVPPARTQRTFLRNADGLLTGIREDVVHAQS